MADQQATSGDSTNMKKALVGAGFLKSTSLSAAQEAKLTRELARQGVDLKKKNTKLICSLAHYCIVIPKKTVATTTT